MVKWNSIDWTSHDPEIDAEHQKLHQMVSSLTAVVANDSGIGMGAEAVDILTERMKLHFGLEEQSMAGMDEESGAILRDDHQRLLGLLKQVRTVMGLGRLEEASALVRLFSSELNKHDVEIDVPLFRMAATRNSDIPG